MMFFRRVSINNVFLKNSRQSYAIFPVQFKNNKLLIFQLRAENSTAPASTAAASFLLRGFAKRKRVIFKLNGGFPKRKRVIFA